MSKIYFFNTHQNFAHTHWNLALWILSIYIVLVVPDFSKLFMLGAGFCGLFTIPKNKMKAYSFTAKHDLILKSLPGFIP